MKLHFQFLLLFYCFQSESEERENKPWQKAELFDFTSCLSSGLFLLSAAQFDKSEQD